MFFVGNELCPFMKWFLWTTNWVPWHMLAACISLYLQSPSVWGQCRIVSPLRWRALSSVMPLSMFPCFGWMRIYALLTVHAAFVLSCSAPTSRFGKQGSRFSFCVIHTCMFRDGCWIPSPSQIRGVCAAFVPHVQLRWVVADGMLQKFVESVTQSATTHSCKPKVKPGLTCLPHGWVTIMC